MKAAVYEDTKKGRCVRGHQEGPLCTRTPRRAAVYEDTRKVVVREVEDAVWFLKPRCNH
jgi:hypothetical protein